MNEVEACSRKKITLVKLLAISLKELAVVEVVTIYDLYHVEKVNVT